MFDFFTSDTHYFHKNIIKYCHRPFSDAAEMNEAMIENYNKVVGKNDTVLWCGDNFFCDNAKAREVLNRLNGKKVSLVGNHDPDSEFKLAARGFEFVSHRLFMKIANRNIVLSHFDASNFRSPWDDRYEELRPRLTEYDVLIHGHTHQKSPLLLNQVNVGVDAWGFSPVSYDDVKREIEKIKPNLSDYKEEIKVLLEYKELIRSKKDPIKREESLNLLANPKYDPFRSLGWEKEIERERSM